MIPCQTIQIQAGGKCDETRSGYPNPSRRESQGAAAAAAALVVVIVDRRSPSMSKDLSFINDTPK